MSAQTIYNQLRAAGLTHEGACGLMGNLKAESGLKANIVQRGMQGLSDEAYTANADGGRGNFVGDAVGYGLAQWTFWSRKQALMQYAQAHGCSVGDETMQVGFCLQELRESYASLYSYLCSTDDMQTATSRVCKEYERPAHNNIATRYKYAQEFADFRPNEEAAVKPQEKPQTTPVVEHAAECTVKLPIARRGSKGVTVKMLQTMLVSRTISCGRYGADGDFGANTENAVKKFQQLCELDDDGIVGGETWKALLTR